MREGENLNCQSDCKTSFSDQPIIPPWTFQISMNNLEFRSVLKFFHLEPRCVEGIAKLSVPGEIEVTDKIQLRGSYNRTSNKREQKFAVELR